MFRNSQNHIFYTFAPLETRKKLDRVDFCKARWDRYWGRAGQLLDNFFVVPGNSPRSLCESKLGPVSFWFLKWRIVKYHFFLGSLLEKSRLAIGQCFSLSLVTAPEVFAKVNVAQSPCFQSGESLIIVRQRYFHTRVCRPFPFAEEGLVWPPCSELSAEWTVIL